MAELRARGISSQGLAGPWVWVPVHDQEKVISMLFDRGWLVVGGEAVDGNSPHGIRISVARLDGSLTRRLADDLLEVLAA